MTKLNQRELEELKVDILIDLLKHGYVGGRHTSFDNIQKGFPKSKRGNVKKVAKLLGKEGIVQCRPTSKKGYSKCSINPVKIEEIMLMPMIIKAAGYDIILSRRIKNYYSG